MPWKWTGQAGTLPIKDPVTGETVPAYLFVGVLPCSCYVYAELCSDMKSENWLLCHVHAYEYFGGVPRLTIPDNLRTGVLKKHPSGYSPEPQLFGAMPITMVLRLFLRAFTVRRIRAMPRAVSLMRLRGSWQRCGMTHSFPWPMPKRRC